MNHGNEEYVRGNVHTNTVEGFFSILKRGVNGVYHHVSRGHLGRYCDEFAFRYENRNVSDSLQAASVRKRGPLGPGMGTVSAVPMGCDVDSAEG